MRAATGWPLVFSREAAQVSLRVGTILRASSRLDHALPAKKQAENRCPVAGFVTEFLVAGALLASFPHGFGRWVAGVALAHLVSYRFYAGESESDFKWL